MLIQNNKIDILVTDLLMPKLGGLQLIKKLQESSVRLETVVVTTAYGEIKYLLDAISLKVDGYIIKPTEIVELLDTLAGSVASKKRANCRQQAY
jgi:YesN/AraC family two-component response regulator